MKRLCVFIYSVLVVFFSVNCGKTSKLTHKPNPKLEVSNPYNQWLNGPSKDTGFFPIGVWLQDPKLALKYKEAGFNTYVGLHKGPTEDQLSLLQKAGMNVFCKQNSVGLQNLDNPLIIGWMQDDEPDNAQSLGEGKGYGPPITPEQILKEYQSIKQNDSSRPVMLNLGQGVAWDSWRGRGVRTNHPEDYVQYMKGGDIVSFDIYPVAHSHPEVSGNLWYIAQGVDRLLNWSDGKKTIWNCIECTHISTPDKIATPHQVRAEVWMSIIHGSQGLIYFVHQFKPVFRAAALLDDPEMLAAVTSINKQVASLAPVLNSPSMNSELQIDIVNNKANISYMLKKRHGITYLFTVGMRDEATSATFYIPFLSDNAIIEVLGENREIRTSNKTFSDSFKPWDVHIYKIKN